MLYQVGMTMVLLHSRSKKNDTNPSKSELLGRMLNLKFPSLTIFIRIG